MRLSLPPLDEVTPDTPLRLGVAAALAFPDGSMTASGLRLDVAAVAYPGLSLSAGELIVGEAVPL